MKRLAGILRKFLRTWAIPIFIAIYFLALTWTAVWNFFSPDDLMNVYQGWQDDHAGPLIRANLLFFRPSPWPRPLASLILRALYTWFGLHSTQFKLLNFGLLVANIFLSYAIVRRLAGSRTAAGIATLLLCYQGHADDLYYNTGFIFDVLCFFFYFSAALIYIRARSDKRYPNIGELLAICLLYICALNSKELSVTLPAMLLLYELFYHGVPRDWKSLFDFRRWSGLLATGVLTLAVVAGRILAGTLIQEGSYKPSFSFAQLMKTSTDFAGNLFFNPGHVAATTVIAVWIFMAAIAWFSKSRTLRFAWLFLMLAPAPVAFIDPRGLPQYYIALFGWMLYAGALLDLGFWWTLRKVQPAQPVRARIYGGAAILFALAVGLFLFWRTYNLEQPDAIFGEAEVSRSALREMRRLAPVLQPRKPGERPRILFIDDPYRADWWNLTFLLRLGYHDRDLIVDRAKTWPAPPTADQMAAYDGVFDLRGGHIFQLAAPWRLGPTPMVVIEDGRPHISHTDWTRVNREHPAHPGETLMLKAMDLGATLPPLLPGQKFAADPMSLVISPVKVRLYGMDIPVTGKAGWPEESNTYRVDIRIPDKAPRGLLWLDISVNGVTGPLVEFPVK